jgi:hypothetical protein
MKKFTSSAGRCLKNDGGNIAISFGLLMVPMSMAFGAAFDLGRQLDAKQSLTVAMDSAVLAGTQYLFENKNNLAGAIKVSEDYFYSIIPRGKFDTLDIKFKLNGNKNGIAAYGNADIPTTLLKIVGHDTLDVLSDAIPEAATAEIEATESELEISVMLDVTSSMCDDGVGPCTSGIKISALKEAATDLVQTLLGDKKPNNKARIALVPFSTRVRVGPDGGGAAIMKDLTNLDATWSGNYKSCISGSGSGGAETAGNWTCDAYETQVRADWKVMPCVTDRHYNMGWSFETTDKRPGNGFWLNSHDGSRMPVGPDSSATMATTQLGTPLDPASHWNYNSAGTCADVSNENEIVPLTDDVVELKNRISKLVAYGATSGALGTAFSWYVLSPEWDSIWQGDSKPKAYKFLSSNGKKGEARLRKIAILMTDGSYNTLRGWKENDVDAISAAAVSLCKNMKSSGIEIFTVGFALDNLPSLEKPTAVSTLSNCATSPSHFHDSSSPADLKLAFKAIGARVAGEMTRLTK